MNYNNIDEWLIWGESILKLKGQIYDRQTIVDILNDNYVKLYNSKSIEDDLINLINERNNMSSLYEEINLQE